jgi:hypothetical protein
MGKPSKQIMAFMERFKVDSDEIWEVRSGGSWAIKHYALERVAAEQGITFEPPTMIECNGLEKNVAMLVRGKMGDRSEWSIGEASPSNYRTTEKMAAYPYAIAEKRGKDRVILKLLNSHGQIYSEEEFDPSERRRNPHVTRPEDIADPIEYDQHGNPVDNIPLGDIKIERLPKAKAKGDWAACQAEIVRCTSAAALERWGKDNANRTATFDGEWQEMLRQVYREQMDKLRQGRAA